jgi:hypothetical protein
MIFHNKTMKNIRALLFALIFMAVGFSAAFVATPVNAGLVSFKADLITAFTNDFTAGDRTRVSNAFVNAYTQEWNARVASGTADTPANRGAFAADKVIMYVQAIVSATEQQAAVSVLPTPTPLPQ